MCVYRISLRRVCVPVLVDTRYTVFLGDVYSTDRVQNMKRSPSMAYTETRRDELNITWLFHVHGVITYDDGDLQEVIAGEQVVMEHTEKWTFEELIRG